MEQEKCMDLDFLKIQYQVLSNRQLAHNTSVWNVPALLFAAETILWSISLSDASGMICCCISLVAVLVALASWQQFERGRLMEIADSEQLYAIERIMKESAEEPLSRPVMIVHQALVNRTVLIGGEERNLKDYLETKEFYQKNLFVHIRRFYVWRIMFFIIFLLSLILLFYNLYEKWPLLT